MTSATRAHRDDLPITVIEASAGTGKTYRLAEEIYRAVAAGEVRPEAILLTTFTRRAAAELTSRVTSRLIGAGRTREAMRVGQARIGTIHSVCGRLLEQFALRAGLAVRQNVIPESEQRRLLNEALSTVLKPEENEDLHLMAQCLYRPDWRDDVRELISQARSNAIPPEQFAGYAEASVREILEALPAVAGSLEECLRLAREVEPQLGALVDRGGDTYKNTRDALHVVRSYLALAERGVAVYWQRFQQLARATAAKRTAAHAIYQPLADCAAAHHRWPEFRRQLGAYVRAIFAVAARTCERYEWIKAQSGVIDFADQEALAARLLEQAEVRDALGAELDLVLVDEFQDTSPLQLHLFLLLARCARRSVWVGDPKQAIFGFRGTDPQLMLGVIERLAAGTPDAGAGARERLDRSWRSLPQLVDWVSATFEPVFARQGLDPRAVVLHPQREGKLPAGSLESWVCRADNQEEDYAAIGGAVARCLERAADYPVLDADGEPRPLRVADLAIVARTNAECAGLAQALAAAGVPYEMSTAGLLRQPVCELLLAALTLLLDPYDRLAVAQVTWFHDVWSAVTDAAQQRRQASAWLAARVREANARDGERHPVAAALAAAAAGAALLSPAELVRRAADIAGVWRLVQGSAAPARAAADVDQFLALVSEYEEVAAQRGQGVTNGGLLAWLRALADAGDDQRHAAASNAVRITTWHGAKGLEWPMVILYGFGDEPQTRFFGISAFTAQRDDGHDVTDPLHARALRFVPFPYHEATRNCGYRMAFADTERFRAAAAGDARERTRLLYVIMTRARDRLVIAARPKARGGLRGLEVDGAPLCHVPQKHEPPVPGWRVQEALPNRSERRTPVASEWFEYRAPPPLVPARALPSRLHLPPGAGAAAVAGAVTRFAEPVPVAGRADPTAVGAALHRLLAVNFGPLPEAHQQQVAQRVLSSLAPGTVAPEPALRCKRALDTYVARHWPTATLRREWPVSLQLGTLRVDGVADLVAEQEAGFVLIDYKTLTGGAEPSAHGLRYAPQLAAYRLALERALGKACAATLICYPLRGELLELRIPDPERVLVSSAAAMDDHSPPVTIQGQ